MFLALYIVGATILNTYKHTHFLDFLREIGGPGQHHDDNTGRELVLAFSPGLFPFSVPGLLDFFSPGTTGLRDLQGL